MDLFSKLTAYDFMGCIPPGFFLLAAIDYLFGTQFVLDGDWDISKGTLVFFMAYIGGHLIATPSSALLEKVIAQRWLGDPMRHMLWGEKIRWWHRLISADYFKPMSNHAQASINSKLPGSLSDKRNSASVFWHIYSIAKRDEHANVRLSNFLSLYGFCRNISFVCLLSAIAVAVKANWPGAQLDGNEWYVVAGSALAAFMMFQRYLKFFRSYAGELLPTFDQVVVTPLGPQDTQQV